MILNLIFDTLFLQDSLPENEFIIFCVVLIILYFTLHLMRVLRVFKKRMCPSCSGKLSRKKRTAFDKMLVIVSLNILPFRRYKCIHCGWEGVRWNDTKHRSKDAY